MKHPFVSELKAFVKSDDVSNKESIENLRQRNK